MIDTLPRLHIGQGRHFGGVSLFPLWAEAPELRQLAYADQSGIRATEREGSPVVHELVLANPGANPVLLLGGELFEGGWQHRALDADMILGPGRQTVARVSCVEAGRWHGHGSQVHRSRRASVLVRAAQAMTRDGDRQGEVWRRVSRYDAAFGAAATSSFVDHLDRRGAAARGRSRAIPVGSEGLRTLAGQRGVLVGIGGQPAFLELFPSTRALNRQLAALVQAVIMDAALAPAVPTPGRRARRLVERLERIRLATDLSHDAVDGRAVGGHTAYLRATGVMWQDQLAHATVFNPRHPLLVAA